MLLPTCCVSFGKFHVRFFRWEQGNHITWGFWKDYQSRVQRIYTFVVNIVHFPPKAFSLKDLMTYLHFFMMNQKKKNKTKTHMCQNNDHFSVMKLMRELSGSWASSLQRQLQAEQEMQYFLGFACGPKTAFSRLVWYQSRLNVLPLAPLSDYILFSYNDINDSYMHNYRQGSSS